VHRMLLHAERLAFPHPDGRRIAVTAPLDAEFVRAFGLFGWSAAAWQAEVGRGEAG